MLKWHNAFLVVAFFIVTSCAIKEVNDEKNQSAQSSQRSFLLQFIITKPEQELLKLNIAPAQKVADGGLLVPSDSLQEVEAKTVVFLYLGEDQFAMQEVQVLGQDDSGVLLNNISENDLIVVQGAPQVKTGVVRLMNRHNDHDHSHGPGGHAH